MHDIHKSVKNLFTTQTSWAQLAEYFRFLMINNGGLSKASSGMMQIYFNPENIELRLGGYDSKTIKSMEKIVDFSEEALKATLILTLEYERRAQSEQGELF